MERWLSPHRQVALVVLTATIVASFGCALLLPPSWRGNAPVPLAGPIDPHELDGTPVGGDEALASLSDEALAAYVAADRERLVEIASEPGEGPMATEEGEAELREIAARLPRYQRELERRRRDAGEPVGRPVIR